LINELKRNPSTLSFEGNNDFQPCWGVKIILLVLFYGNLCTVEVCRLTFLAHSDSEGKQWSSVCCWLPQQGGQGEAGCWHKSSTWHDHSHHHASSSKRGDFLCLRLPLLIIHSLYTFGGNLRMFGLIDLKNTCSFLFNRSNLVWPIFTVCYV